MANTNNVALGIIIVLAFIWRFARTRQLYLTSLRAKVGASEPISFSPHDLRSFIEQAFLGRRSMRARSFFVRALVFLVVALCLLPFKQYNLWLFWLVIVLIALYVIWCIAHGVMLNRRLPRNGTS
jgi:hypothetical protein